MASLNFKSWIRFQYDKTTGEAAVLNTDVKDVVSDISIEGNSLRFKISDGKGSTTEHSVELPADRSSGTVGAGGISLPDVLDASAGEVQNIRRDHNLNDFFIKQDVSEHSLIIGKRMFSTWGGTGAPPDYTSGEFEICSYAYVGELGDHDGAVVQIFKELGGAGRAWCKYVPTTDSDDGSGVDIPDATRVSEFDWDLFSDVREDDVFSAIPDSTKPDLIDGLYGNESIPAVEATTPTTRRTVSAGVDTTTYGNNRIGFSVEGSESGDLFQSSVGQPIRFKKLASNRDASQPDEFSIVGMFLLPLSLTTRFVVVTDYTSGRFSFVLNIGGSPTTVNLNPPAEGSSARHNGNPVAFLQNIINATWATGWTDGSTHTFQVTGYEVLNETSSATDKQVKASKEQLQTWLEIGTSAGGGLESGDDFPASPTIGDIFALKEETADSTKGIYCYNGTSWDLIAGVRSPREIQRKFLETSMGDFLETSNGQFLEA